MKRETLKEYIFACLIVGLAILSWYFLYQTLYFIDDSGGIFWIWPVIGFLLFFTAFSLGSLFIEKRLILYSSFALALFSFYIFFHGGMSMAGLHESVYYLIWLVLLFLAFLFGAKKIRNEKNERTRLRIWNMLKRALPIIFTVLCILISFAYYFSPSLAIDREGTGLEIPRPLFDKGIKPFGSLIRRQLPGYRPDLKVDEFLENLAERKLSSWELALERREFAQKLNIEIKGDETLNDVLYKITQAQLGKSKASFRKYIPVALLLFMFLSLRIVSIFFIMFLILFTWIVLKILIALGVVTIEKKIVKLEALKL